MQKSLADFPRPTGDNGRGLCGYANAGWRGGGEGFDYWIRVLVRLRIKWFRVVDDNGDSLALCEKLIAAGIFPVVRILRRDPPPNNSPEPNPGHIGPREEETIRRLIHAGARYFETNQEPDQVREWKSRAMPSEPAETAKMVALNWLFDARLILHAGGLPALPAISAGGNLNLIGALAALGRQDILLEGAWIAIHNSPFNRPLNFPDEPVNRAGQALSPDEYEQGAYTEWAWWHNHLQRAQTLAEINAIRASDKNPMLSLADNHACFREFEFYDQLAHKYLGRSIPMISAGGGFQAGNRHDPRYARVTPELHRDGTVALFDYMQRQAPDYYFAAMPALLIESPETVSAAWHSLFWQTTFNTGSDGRDEIPTVSVPNANLGNHLPVIEAVETMPNLARRLPGMMPQPPLEMPATILTATLRAPARTQPMPSPAMPIQIAPPPESATQFPNVALPPPPETRASEPRAQKSHRDAQSAFSEDECNWDPRLDAVNVRVEPAKFARGQSRWQLIRAEYQSPEEAGGKHQIVFIVLDESNLLLANQRVWQSWTEDQSDALTDAKGVATIPIWASYSPENENGPYSAWVDGLPSDRVVGIGLPLKRRVSFILTWKKVANQG